MMNDIKKAGKPLLAILLLFVLLVPAKAFAEDAWAVFSADPTAGATLKQGDMVAYTLIIQTDAKDEQMLRIQTPMGVTLSENAFVYRPQSNEDAEYSAIWGNDGCVLTLPALAKGDMLMFVARVTEAAGETLVCTVTWGEDALTLSHGCELPPPAESEEPAVELEKSALPQDIAPQNDGGDDVAVQGGSGDAPFPEAVENRQIVALLICAMLLPASCVGLALSIRRLRSPIQDETDSEAEGENR